ncbi:MAG: alpha/beta fold hydrolase [Pseudomonadales bacterium]|nr:alpha/beta fold hydrolase [Pseudomonadales bacterium]
MQGFPDKETRLFIPGPVGQLQAIVTPGKETDAENQGTSRNGGDRVAIVCHPHSLMGGTMNNKVVHTIMRAFRDQGYHVVRFNFRGVEKSEGEYADGIGESDDLLAVFAWIKQILPASTISMAGFSFGSFVSARTLESALDQGYEIEQLLLVAPAVENYPFEDLTEFGVPLRMIYGDQDEVVDAGSIASWYLSVISAKDVVCLDGAGHFFHARLTDLKDSVEKLCF